MTTTSSSPFGFSFRGFEPEAFLKFFPSADTVRSYAREAVEASTDSTRASVKGMQDAGQTLVDLVREQVSLSVETGKKLSGVGSIQDAVDLQTEFVKSSFDTNVRGFNELADVYTDTLIGAVNPFVKQAKKAAKASKSA